MTLSRQRKTVTPVSEAAQQRLPGHLEPGGSTAVGTNVSYRLGKLVDLGVLRGRWLDCGCADGGYTSGLAQRGAGQAVGIDLDASRVRRASERLVGSRAVQFCCASSSALPFGDGAFDGVFLNEVLEHVEDEAATLGEIRRVLRPGGYLVVMSPNRWFPFEGHGMRVFGRGIPFPIPFLPWLPSRLTRQVLCARNYWPGELREIVVAAGFQVKTAASILPVFEVYPWIPRRVIGWYRPLMGHLEQVPGLRKLGVSTLILAQAPLA
jgi:SAM-dependent methyltransferase